MASKPALVLVPGMSSVATIVYKPLIESLKGKHGFVDITPVNLPSVDSMATKASLKPSGLHVDIAAVRAAVEPYLKDDKDVVVIGHSYGGTPSLYAIDDLWKSNQPGKPGVLKAILLAASLTLPGGSVAGDREEYKQKHGGINDGEPTIQPVGDVSSYRSRISPFRRALKDNFVDRSSSSSPLGLKTFGCTTSRMKSTAAPCGRRL